MRFFPEMRPILAYMVKHFPDDVYFDIGADGKVGIQANTQAAVRQARAAFPGVIWKKTYSEGCAWWEYDGTVERRRGFFAEPLKFDVHIYACHEAPPTCVARIEEVEVEEQVPVQFAKRIVRKQVIRWDCSGEEREPA